MAQSLALLAVVLFSIWLLLQFPVESSRDVLATIGAFVVFACAVIGILSVLGSVRLWWVRRGIEGLKREQDELRRSR